VTLVCALLSEGLGEHVVHGCRRESHGERPFWVVSRHRGDVEPLGNVDLHWLVGKRKDSGDLSHSVGTVVEHEHGVALYSSACRADFTHS
jgi:hypothetical protein